MITMTIIIEVIIKGGVVTTILTYWGISNNYQYLGRHIHNRHTWTWHGKGKTANKPTTIIATLGRNSHFGGVKLPILST
jgi:hypothetical protein